jgi:hypothetical protein
MRARQVYQGTVDSAHGDASFWYAPTLEDWLRRYLRWPSIESLA